MAGEQLRLPNQMGRVDGLRAEAQVRNGDRTGLVGVVNKGRLAVQPGGITHDRQGVFVGTHRAVGAKPHKHGPEGLGRLHIKRGIHRQGVVGEVVDDPHREMGTRLALRQVVEHRLHHRRVELLGGEPVAAADHQGPLQLRPVLLNGRHHIQQQGLGLTAGLLAAIQYSQAAGARRQCRHQGLGCERPEQPHLQQSHPLPLGHEGIGGGHGGFAAAAHQHQHPFRFGVAVVVEQVVLATRVNRELIHDRLHMGRHGIAEGIHCLARLKTHIRVLAGAPQLRMVGAEPPAAMGGHQLDGHQGPQHRIADPLHPLQFVGGAEAIKPMQHRHPPPQGGGHGDGGAIGTFLHRAGAEQGAARAPCRHHITVVAKDGEGRCGQRPGGHMDHGAVELSSDPVEVGEHQQQPLRGGERGGERPHLQGSMHHPRRTGLALHLDHLRHLAPEVWEAFRGPGIHPFAHGGGRGDRVEGHHLAEAIGNPSHRFVAIHPGAVACGHGSGSNTVRAIPTCTSN